MPDIIIPIFNEEKILTEEATYFKNLKTKTRVIFVDGGSSDRSIEIARKYGDVILSLKGKGVQKNMGVRESTSNYLLVVHVDTFIQEETLDRIDQTLNSDVVGGCLTMHIRDKGFIFRVYEWIVNFRSRAFGVIDGDLGMFVRRDVFERLGGFDHIPLMEDLVFARKLRDHGRIKVLQDPIDVSSRKWYEQGFMKTFIDYTNAYLMLWTGCLKNKNDVVSAVSK